LFYTDTKIKKFPKFNLKIKHFMAEITASDVKTLFDRIAPVYDQLNQWLSLGQHRIWKDMTVKWIEPKLGDIALDICCGSGDLTQILAKKVGNTGQVFGLDFSPQQLAIAKKRTFPSPSHGKINWIEGDALNLPFKDQQFDCATMSYGLRNVMDIPRCLTELYRVLKPNARAAILDFQKPSSPLVLGFQQWYLDNIVVKTAELFGLTSEYAYIMSSLEKFPDPQRQIQLSFEAGFQKVNYYSIAGGLMGVLVLVK
jgi:demethylphylloquinol methyltransferase